MHEMGVIQSVLSIVEANARQSNASSILKINIRMGEYSDVVPQILKKYFEIAAHNTIAEGAQLILNRVPAVIECKDCGWKGPVDHQQVTCPKCRSERIIMVSGREFFVESIEVQ